jgi:hypothetical protein
MLFAEKIEEELVPPFFGIAQKAFQRSDDSNNFPDYL